MVFGFLRFLFADPLDHLGIEWTRVWSGYWVLSDSLQPWWMIWSFREAMDVVGVMEKEGFKNGKSRTTSGDICLVLEGQVSRNWIVVGVWTLLLVYGSGYGKNFGAPSLFTEIRSASGESSIMAFFTTTVRLSREFTVAYALVAIYVRSLLNICSLVAAIFVGIGRLLGCSYQILLWPLLFKNILRGALYALVDSQEKPYPSHYHCWLDPRHLDKL